MDYEKQMQQFLASANEEEKNVLFQALQGFEKTRNYHYDYISGFLGIEGGQWIEEAFIVQMPIAPLSNNRFGMTHGGLLATLADNTMGYMVNQTLLEEGKFSVTSDLSIRYLSPGQGELLVAKGTIIKKGKKMVVTQCDIYNESNVHIAVATATFVVVN